MFTYSRQRVAGYLKQSKNIPKLWQRGFQEAAASPPLEDVMSMRRQQAQKSLLVEVAGSSSAGELCSVCEQYGNVEAMFHYSTHQQQGSSKEMILVEFSKRSELEEALRSTLHSPSKGSPPSHTPAVWLSAGKVGKRGQQGASVPTPALITTPPLDRDELLMRLLQCGNVSEQIQALHESQKLTELGCRLRFFTCRQIESALSGLFPNAAVLPFGSSVNSFGSRDSDLDMTLEPGGLNSSQEGGKSRLIFQSKGLSNSANPRLTLQRRMEVISEVIEHFIPGCAQVRRILNARVPIIKYRQNLTSIDCDLTMDNRSGYHMSRMLHLYGTTDPRVVPLVGAVRRWARCRGLTSPYAGRWITNYTLTLMVLTYLMNTSPPLLLPLKVLQVVPGIDEETGEAMFIVPKESAVTAAVTAMKNTDSLEVLFRGFFAFFDTFNFRERGMSIITGKNFVKPAHCAVYIQNPLEPDLNVSRNVTLEEVERLKTELTNARYIMEGEETVNEGGDVPWGALRLWFRGTASHRQSEGYSIDWRAVFDPSLSTAAREVKAQGNRSQELPGLVSKLKLKAQQKKEKQVRYNRKGKMLY